MNSDPGSVSVVRLAAEEYTAGDERNVEADPESGPRAGTKSSKAINVWLSTTTISKCVELG